jgi:hypothetical protein
MYKFLSGFLGLVLIVLIIGTFGSALVPARPPAQQWADDHAMCEWKANILHTTPAIYEYTRTFRPNMERYITCMVELGQSTQGPHTSGLPR